MDEWKIKREVARKYDLSADVYDTLYVDEQEAKITSALEFAPLRRFDAVLDVGCGTGLLFRHLKEHVRFLVGLDISRKLLEKALFRSKGSSEISLIRADADYLPFIYGVFDKIFAFTVLQNMPNVKATLKEILRVAKRDAIIVLTGLKKSFTRERFLTLVNEAGLAALDIKVHNDLRGYIAICGKKSK